MREIDKRRSFASPQKRLRAYPGRGSDRKLEKCQNSTNKQNMNIVTLFMLNKKWSVLILNSEDQHVYFFAQEFQKLVDESGGASPWNPNPFVHHQKIWLVDFWGILTSFQ